MARDYDVSALGLVPWQGLPLDSAGRWKVSLADEISSLPFHALNPTWCQLKNRGQDSDSDQHLGGSCIPLSGLGCLAN